MEFTFSNPTAAPGLEAAAGLLGDRTLIGAGSVLDPETARVATLAGTTLVGSESERGR